MIKTLAVFLAAALSVCAKSKVVNGLQEASVMVVAGSGSGSGVLVTRAAPDKSAVSFVLTAGHVVDDLRHTREIISSSGGKKTVVEFDDAKIVSLLIQGGRIVGRTTFDAEVLAFSEYKDGEDLAILRVRKRNLVSTSTTTRFFLDANPPDLGTPLWHVGSMLGEMGANSLTTGVLSQHGRLIGGRVYDQTTVTAFPGSSGGGVFLQDGRYVGMLVRGAGEGFNLVVPTRRLHAWCKRVGAEWLVDDKLPLPDSALAERPREEDASGFSVPKK